MVQISVVIPLTPTSTDISIALKELENQRDIIFEVILVLNPEGAKWPDLPVTHFPIKKLESPKGVNYARNKGLEAAEADLVYFLDADCIPENNRLLKNYYEFMNNLPLLSGTGGPYKIGINTSQINQAYHFLQEYWLQSGLLDLNGDCKYLLGGNLLLRKSAIGSERFDQNILFGGTEHELLQRLRKKSHKFRLMKQQAVLHKLQLTMIDICKKAFAQGKDSQYVYKKLGSENSQFINLRLPQLQPELTKYVYLYNLFFEIGYYRGIRPLLQRTLNNLPYYWLNVFSISNNSHSIKERKDS